MEKNTSMNYSGKHDILEGRWRELKGYVRKQWGKLTDDDVERLSGRQEELIGVLQQRYGYGKEQAELEVNKWLREYDNKATKRTPPGKV